MWRTDIGFVLQFFYLATASLPAWMNPPVHSPSFTGFGRGGLFPSQRQSTCKAKDEGRACCFFGRRITLLVPSHVRNTYQVTKLISQNKEAEGEKTGKVPVERAEERWHWHLHLISSHLTSHHAHTVPFSLSLSEYVQAKWLQRQLCAAWPSIAWPSVEKTAIGSTAGVGCIYRRPDYTGAI